jgi:hypothetical protein
MAKKQKPTKAQVAYGKARAGGQNPMKITDAEVRKAGKAAAIIAINAIPTARVARTVAKIASATKATKLSSGASKVKTKTFTQGSRARITNTPPKKSSAGPNSPIKGTKVKVEYKTKELSPRQQANLTTGRVVREEGKKVGTYAKGGATVGIVESERKKSKKKKK